MYEDIKRDFKEIIQYSQGFVPVDEYVNELFDIWAKNKNEMLQLFGGLIYEWPEPICIPISQEEKEYQINKFIDDLTVRYLWDLVEFVKDNSESFYDNKVISSKYESIPVGAKLIKSFRFFISDQSLLRQIQDQASQIIQKTKLSGKLCLSVHPLDFLSSSENTYNWRSCHSLDGDYCAGNLSYMADNTTFMAYIKGEDEVALPHFGKVLWNSKKWRVLIHAAELQNIVFAGRQYPFDTKAMLNIVLDIYNNLLYRHGHPYLRDWSNEYIEKPYLNQIYFPYDGELHGLRQVVKAGRGALNYNDILHSSFYQKPYYTYPKGYWVPELKTITIGNKVPCLTCGEQLECQEMMQCENCDGSSCFTYCDDCGVRCHRDDFFETADGRLICEDCANTNYFRCGRCHELVPIKTSFGDDNELDINGILCCKECSEKIMKESEDIYGSPWADC